MGKMKELAMEHQQKQRYEDMMLKKNADIEYQQYIEHLESLEKKKDGRYAIIINHRDPLQQIIIVEYTIAYYQSPTYTIFATADTIEELKSYCIYKEIATYKILNLKS